MSSGHNTKGGSNGHFDHVDPTKVNVSSLLKGVGSKIKTQRGTFRNDGELSRGKKGVPWEDM